MATTEDNLRLRALENNEPRLFKIRNKELRLHPMTNAVADLADRYVAERYTKLSESTETKELLVNLSKNRTVIPKYVSLLILHSWFKVKFFHWIHWRYIHRKYALSELIAVYKEFSSLNDVSLFFQFTASLQENNRIIKRMSEINTQTIRQELSSEAETK